MFEVGVYTDRALIWGACLVTWLSTHPLIAITIGFLPGCGPQILVASLYLSGIVPMSALIGNALSNDGDALFPAIAIAPRAAIIATIYSAVFRPLSSLMAGIFSPEFLAEFLTCRSR